MPNFVTTILTIILAVCWMDGSAATLSMKPSNTVVEKYVQQNYGVECSSDSNKTHSLIKWTNPRGAVLPPISSPEGIAVFLMNISKAENGKWTCKADGEDSVSFTMHVRERIRLKNTREQRITVRDGGELELKCEVKDSWEPSQNATMEWIHDNVSLMYNETRRLTYFIKNVQRSDKGEYWCRARVTWRLMQPDEAEKKVIVTVQQLRCEVAAEPQASFAWFRKNNQQRWDPLPFDKYEEDDEGQYSILSIEVTDESVAGEYRCRAKNEFGTSDIEITLKLGNRPEAPIQISAENFNDTCLKLNVNTTTTPQEGETPLPVTGINVQWIVVDANMNLTREINEDEPDNIDDDIWQGANETALDFDEGKNYCTYRKRNHTQRTLGHGKYTVAKGINEVAYSIPKKNGHLKRNSTRKNAKLPCHCRGEYALCNLDKDKWYGIRVAVRNEAGLSTYLVLEKPVKGFACKTIASIVTIAMCSSILLLYGN